MPKDKPTGQPITVAEAGSRGGKRVKEKYGSEFYSRIGKKGGDTTRKLGSAHFSAIGKKGGAMTKMIHGKEYYAEIGKSGHDAMVAAIKAKED